MALEFLPKLDHSRAEPLLLDIVKDQEAMGGSPIDLKVPLDAFVSVVAIDKTTSMGPKASLHWRNSGLHEEALN